MVKRKTVDKSLTTYLKCFQKVYSHNQISVTNTVTRVADERREEVVLLSIGLRPVELIVLGDSLCSTMDL